MRLALALALLAPLAAGCSRDGRAEPQSKSQPVASAQRAACGHSFCGDNFFVDVDPGAACSPGATCTTTLKLVATGAFHINDEYPYRFKADDAPGVEFLGSDGAGKNVFSKVASDWRKNDEKSGTMGVKWRAAAGGDKNIGGVLKLSVCSAQSCQIDQAPVQATVAVR
jgi:hypothetical protein